jgi:hypothetical protein
MTVCPFCGRLDCDGEQGQRHWRWWAEEEERRTGKKPTTLNDVIDEAKR